MSLDENIGIDSGGVFMPLLRAGTPLPAETTQVFSTALDDLEVLDVDLHKGNRMMIGDTKHLGTFRISGFEPRPRGVPQIAVTIRYDGELTVSAAEGETALEVERR